jgi:hypothetical protein
MPSETPGRCRSHPEAAAAPQSIAVSVLSLCLGSLSVGLHTPAEATGASCVPARRRAVRSLTLWGNASGVHHSLRREAASRPGVVAPRKIGGRFVRLTQTRAQRRLHLGWFRGPVISVLTTKPAPAGFISPRGAQVGDRRGADRNTRGHRQRSLSEPRPAGVSQPAHSSWRKISTRGSSDRNNRRLCRGSPVRYS